MTISSLTRRSFLSYGLSAGALLVAAPTGLLGRAHAANQHEPAGGLSPLAEIRPDNSILFFSPSPDMGQGVDTSLAMLFAEELDADFDRVTSKPLAYGIKQGEDGRLTFKAVPQFAGGSTSTPRNWPLLRAMGRTTRQLLLQAAAWQLGVPLEDLRTEKSHVLAPDGTRISYGSLAAAAAAETLPEGFEPELKARSDWSIIGTPRKQGATRDIVMGKPLYAMDMDYPGAKAAMIARSPYLDGYVEALDDTAARALDGVIDIVVLERPDPERYYTYLAAGVAVVAEDIWTAAKARDLLNITWNRGPFPNESSEELHAQCDRLLEGEGQIVRNDGDFNAAMSSAARTIRRTYKLPLVSHAQLEPQNCLAHVREDDLTIIAPMQSPGGAGRIAAAITGIDRLNMDIRYTRLGGGFGRRLSNDHVAEAVTISKATGLPIRLQWTREDDLAHDFYRPMGHHELVAAFDGAGKMTAWSHRLAGTPKYYRRDNTTPDTLFGADLYVDDFPAALVDNLRHEYFVARSGTPQGSWRAPAHTANAFVVQSFLDEIADELNEDPLALRLRLLGAPQELEYGQHGGPVFDTGRLAHVLRVAAEQAGWGKTMPRGQAQGIAGHFTFGGYCALVADVELMEGGDFRVRRVTGAVDVGTVVNPEGVRAQMEGGINDGLSTARGQEVIYEAGRMVNDNFDRYRMMRIKDAVPEIDVHIVESEAAPSGMGEMSIPPLAPAVANAVVRAGGRRMRAQPFISERAANA